MDESGMSDQSRSLSDDREDSKILSKIESETFYPIRLAPSDRYGSATPLPTSGHGLSSHSLVAGKNIEPDDENSRLPEIVPEISGYDLIDKVGEGGMGA